MSCVELIKLMFLHAYIMYVEVSVLVVYELKTLNYLVVGVGLLPATKRLGVSHETPTRVKTGVL